MYCVWICIYMYTCVCVCLCVCIISVKCWWMHYVNQSPHNDRRNQLCVYLFIVTSIHFNKRKKMDIRALLCKMRHEKNCQPGADYRCHRWRHLPVCEDDHCITLDIGRASVLPVRRHTQHVAWSWNMQTVSKCDWGWEAELYRTYTIFPDLGFFLITCGAGTAVLTAKPENPDAPPRGDS